MNTFVFYFPEFGQFCLCLALAISILQCGIQFFAADNLRLINIPNLTSKIIFCLLSIAVIVLVGSFVFNNFHVLYVLANSNRNLPLFYRITAFWGAHSGSVLLWLWLLSIWHMIIVRGSTSLEPKLANISTLVCVLVIIIFLLYILISSNPFLLAAPPYLPNGADLNPLLQDPGFVIHPPLLYAGYVGLVAPFALAIAVLLTTSKDSNWAPVMYRWTLIAWIFLSLGITLGSWWSYRQLGWGGWWFWDPVENASFMPWLAATALLHALINVCKRRMMKAWALGLALLGFSLSILGTFLVRSGILISVHAFAVDPERGKYLLCFMLVVVVVATILHQWRARDLNDSAPYTIICRESILYLNNLLLIVMLATVLLGTLYPLLMQVLELNKMSVGAPYFNITIVPQILVLLFLMGVATNIKWRHDSLTRMYQINLYPLFAALCLAFLWQHIAYHRISIMAWLALSMAIFVLIHSLYIIMRGDGKLLPMAIAHIGVAISVLGVAQLSMGAQQRDVAISVGGVANIDNINFKLQAVHTKQASNYMAYVATVAVRDQRGHRSNLYPELRVYNASKIVNPKAAIWIDGMQDVYVILAQNISGDKWAMRLYLKPYVRFIWLGAIFMALGGLLALRRRFKL